MGDKTERLGLTRLTAQWLQDRLQEAFKTKSTIEQWTVEEIGEGKGFVSQILRVSVSWEPQMEGLPESVVLKVPGKKQMERLRGKFEISEEKQKLLDTFKEIGFMDHLIRTVSSSS